MYKGFGFISKDVQVESLENMEDIVEFQSHSSYRMSLITQFLSEYKSDKVIFFK